MQGKVYSNCGMLVNDALLQLVHLQLKAGESVAPHDHKGQEVYFTLIQGEVTVSLDEAEEHHLVPGQVLHFAGEARVGVQAHSDSEFFVYLINRH